MKAPVSFVLLLVSVLASSVTASVFLPKTMEVKTGARTFHQSPSLASKKGAHFRSVLRQRRASKSTAMAIPGYGVAEQVFVGGFQNFLSIYNLIITARILLSWFPQAQGIGALQPVYAITDPYLNLFRGIIPPLFGLDFSPIIAFVLLSALSNATAAVGCEIPPHQQMPHAKFNNRPSLLRRNTLPAKQFGRSTTTTTWSNDKTVPSMNY